MKSSQIYVSTCSFQNRDLGSIIKECETNNINSIELSVLKNFSIEEIVKLSNKINFIVHNYFPQPDDPFLLNIASQNKDNLRRSIEFCKNAIDIAEKIRSPIYGVHGGFSAEIPTKALGKPELQMQIFNDYAFNADNVYRTIVESACELCEYANGKGIQFLIENNVISKKNGRVGKSLLPMATSEELLRLISDVNDKNFGILVDVGHAKVSSVSCGFNLDKFMRDLMPHIKGFHLSDNDGVYDRNDIFDETAWFLPYLNKAGMVPITLELNRVTLDEITGVSKVVQGYI